MPRVIVSRDEIDFAPGENTFGLKVIRERYDDGKTFWKYGLPNVVQIMGLTRSCEVIAINEWQAGLGAHYTHLVGGNVEEGELPHETAQRELLEETGYKTGILVHLPVALQDTGRSDRQQHFFLAMNCEKAKQGEKEIKVKLFTLDQFFGFLMEYFFTNPEKPHGGANSLTATMLAFKHIGILKLDLSAISNRLR